MSNKQANRELASKLTYHLKLASYAASRGLSFYLYHLRKALACAQQLFSGVWYNLTTWPEGGFA